jgi:hypothetical protein
MKQRFVKWCHKVASNPLLNLLAGLILLVTGLIECAASICGGWFDIPVGSHHGVILFALLQITKALPDTLKGINFLEVAGDVPKSGDAAPATGTVTHG